MKKFKKVLGLVLLTGILAACQSNSDLQNIPDSDPYFPGKVARKTYKTLTASAITDLNYLKVQAGASAAHFANFVDGLLLHNSYGSLEKNLATKVVERNSYQQFDVTIREGVPWVRYDGSLYAPTVNGVSTQQFVSANDFVASAKAILTQPNGSETAFLIYNFVEGAVDYYQASYLMDKIANGGSSWAVYKDNAKFATKLNSLIKELTGVAGTHTADEVDDIKNFKQVGIKVIEEPGSNGGGTIRYTLKNSASYFPTLFTYSCYLPVNEIFLKEVRFAQLGAAPDKLLYCGPFRLAESSETSIVYKKNESYWNLDRVHLDTINYQVVPADAGYDYTRTEFEEGRIDGFTLSTKDTEGWNKYIVGEDGTGDILNPADPYVNSRDYDVIDYVYGLNINVKRASNSVNGSTAGKSYATNGYGGSTATVRNTEKALYLQEVRDLIIASFDIAQYCTQYSELPEYQSQYMINTYVPRGFVIDDNGNDYTKTHYYEEWGQHNLDRVGQDEDPTKVDLNKVDEIIGQGQYANVLIGEDTLAPLREKADLAINVYNEANPDSKITTPINLEYFSIWTDEQSKAIDLPLINSWNSRINGSGSTFRIIPTSDVTTSNYESITNGGNFDVCSTWGWGPDYGDPMSYLNTFKKNGDWMSIFGFVGDETVTNYRLNSDNTALVENDLLAEYSEKVSEANAQYEDVNERFDLFAEAEYMLINELGIYRPLTMQGQGRQVSISRAVGYSSPSGSYGLSSNRLDGLWVLDQALLRTERQEVIAKHDADKAAYLAEHGSINIYD
ncbi:MAG: ABC transporter substrate-binding protein [Erysipelotrichaceae bacterium]|nr:ABC transporter substrate-binding protein [Erysipelotrichaceae bacterium]